MITTLCESPLTLSRWGTALNRQPLTFTDHYLDVEYDLSQVLFVATEQEFELDARKRDGHGPPKGHVEVTSWSEGEGYFEISMTKSWKLAPEVGACCRRCFLRKAIQRLRFSSVLFRMQFLGRGSEGNFPESKLPGRKTNL